MNEYISVFTYWPIGMKGVWTPTDHSNSIEKGKPSFHIHQCLENKHYKDTIAT